MKKLAFLVGFAALAAVCAQASVTSSNTLCWISVDSPLTNVIVSTTLVDIGLPATNTIAVQDFVLSTNLKQGDMLLRKVKVSGGSWEWQGWTLQEAGGSWNAVSVTKGNVTVSPAEDTALNLANAFLLYRGDPENSNPFFIRGQIENTGTRTQTTTSDDLTLMANASISDVYLDALQFTTGPFQGDRIRLLYDNRPGETTYIYNGTEWCTNAVTITGSGKLQRKTSYLDPISKNSVVIAAGQGFVFEKASSAGQDSTITWPNPLQ